MARGPVLYDSAARLSRTLPHFRGKWQLVDAIGQLLLPLRGEADPLCTVRMKDGSLLTWDLRDPTERRAAWLGTWDEAIRRAILARLARGAVALDIGASVGAWTVPLARGIGAEGRVIAFEPVPANRARLERVVAANALHNVTISPLALGDSERSVDMWLRSSNTGADSGTAAVVPSGHGHLTVSMQTLDSWAQSAQLTRLDFMKLDVEGAELMVLTGAKETVAHHRPIILAEFDEYWMSTHGLTVTDGAQWAKEHRYALLGWDRRAATFRPIVHPGGDTLLVPMD